MRLRLLNALFYGTLAVVGAAALAPRLVPAARALVRRWTYAPELVLPGLWLALGGLLAVTLLLCARQLLAGRPVGLARYVALLLAVALALAARNGVTPPRRPVVGDALLHLLARVEATADRRHAGTARYPDEPAVLEAGLPDELRTLGYWRRGALPLESEVKVVVDADGPVLSPPPDLRPGDLVFAVDAARRRYWITAFVLDRRGRLALSVDASGRARFAAGADGRASSRLDPLFPEYPRPLPLTPKEAR